MEIVGIVTLITPYYYPLLILQIAVQDYLYPLHLPGLVRHEKGVMTDIYPTVAQCAVVATALKLLLFPA